MVSTDAILFYVISLLNSGDSSLRFGMTIYYFIWRERSGDSQKYFEEGQNRVFESPLLSPLYHSLTVSFRGFIQNIFCTPAVMTNYKNK
jgi:hypothetical protein